MLKFGKKVVKYRAAIFVLSILLLAPAAWGYIHTRVNYDVLSYLPGEIETMKGQDILADEFGTGAYSMFVCEGMSNKDVAGLKEKMEQVDHVNEVIWYDSFFDLSMPMEMLPQKVLDIFNSEDSTMMFIIFDTTTSADETMQAIRELRALAGKQCFLSGMSAIVTDTKDLAEKEVLAYVVIAVILSAIVLSVCMESFFIPVLFLLGIGFAIVYNLGTNIFMGEISYITKALAAVLQLGVTMDYSIFLWHSYQEQMGIYEDHKEAMAHAIEKTVKSVVGSSLTTVAGFAALCFMSFTLGLDLGIVMAKGVIIGVICCVTVLPSMIMIFDRVLEKTSHRSFLPDMDRLSGFITRHYRVFALLLVLLIVPAAYCQKNASVYYNLDETLPDYLPSTQANERLQNDYQMGALHMLLIDSSLPSKEVRDMISEMEEVDGVKSVLGMETILGSKVPESMVPESIRDVMESENYELLMISNEYKTASPEVNRQIEALNAILKKHDPSGMLVGEAPCTKDLITITDKDFKVVNSVSILAVFVIILFVFKSWFIPIVLVAVIEFAIFINLGIPYLTGTSLPFIASIVIGTIQLGSTVDYAILMTGRYETERCSGKSKKEAIAIAHRTSMKSVIVSAISFFAATFGVGLYSDIDMISALCNLMARGALISMVVVLCVLPSMFMLLDGVICKTSKNFKEALHHEQK
ncbi:MAG: efflux RND transporter permease subunit [Lachnospiraceae bacterium]|uniref:efflux RND transporter permease subunit n=1 Tax=Parablautia sp. Marseille-Q6255 TaxID=3039593 RepID=UPI0024BC57A0|nr:efflux RND transporter permease subunit [Parablautia sp. Marseille-Q6255]